jgi:hypothetical protein
MPEEEMGSAGAVNTGSPRTKGGGTEVNVKPKQRSILQWITTV